MEEQDSELRKRALSWKRSTGRAATARSVMLKCIRWEPCFVTEARNRKGATFLQSLKASCACRLLRLLSRMPDPKPPGSRLGRFARETGTLLTDKRFSYRGLTIPT